MPAPSWPSGRRGALLASAVLVVLLLVAGLLVQQRAAAEQRRDEAAASAARDVAAAASRGELPDAAVVDGLDALPEVEVTAVTREGDAAVADLRWRWPFGPQGWTYATRLPLSAVGDGDTWAPQWSAAVVHPDLQEGDVLAATRARADRADVLGRDDVTLVTDVPVVEVGVQPSRADDPAALARTLGDLLDVDPVALEERVRSAPPDAFVPVVTLRRTDYDPLRDRLRPLAGTVFHEGTLPLAPSRSFARALLGAAGPVTAEVVEQSAGRLVPGDVAGLSGLQRAYDARLGGTSGVVVERRSAGTTQALHTVAPTPGQPVRLTLDARVQAAADAALATATGGNGTASLVALDVPTGDVLAVANTPVGGADRATTGQYAPGSTFKAVSALALLEAGLAPDEVVPCPATRTVDGRSFRNVEGGQLGDVPFRRAFAQSCNTAFVGLADRLEPQALPEAAARLGLGVPWEVGVDVRAGDVPAATTPVELAATTIGQGRLLASPAAMAQLAATVARGAWAPPRLVLEPAPEAAPAAPPALEPTRVAAVRELMREVVEDGTAAALADVPGPPVHAKTGTAEHGTDSPPRTHAWTIGFQGEVAFAVLVEDGSSGGAVAVPVAEAFLRGLAP